MGTPTNPLTYPTADPLQMAQTEFGDVSSCLHMPRDPIAGPHDDACGPDGYLVNNERWAKHAHEHLDAGREWLRYVAQERATLRSQVRKLEQRLSEKNSRPAANTADDMSGLPSFIANRTMPPVSIDPEEWRLYFDELDLRKDR